MSASELPFNAYVEETINDEVGRIDSFRLLNIEIPDDATVLKEEDGNEFDLYGITLNFEKVYSLQEQVDKRNIATIKPLSGQGVFFYGDKERVTAELIPSGMPRSIIIKSGRTGIIFVEDDIVKNYREYLSNCIPYIVRRTGSIFRDEKGEFSKAFLKYR